MDQTKSSLNDDTEGFLVCDECPLSVRLRKGEVSLYRREGWPRCPVHDRELRFTVQPNRNPKRA